MSTEAMRAAFEAWAGKQYGITLTRNGKNYNGNVNDDWAAWQAATAAERERAALVCEVLVERDADHGGRFGGYGTFMGSKTGPECAAAIRSGK